MIEYFDTLIWDSARPLQVKWLTNWIRVLSRTPVQPTELSLENPTRYLLGYEKTNFLQMQGLSIG